MGRTEHPGRTETMTMTWTQYAAAHGVTPLDPYIEIIDALIDFYSETRPHASMEQVEEWADNHAARWAR